jgi:LacI family transcriptional regulator
MKTHSHNILLIMSWYEQRIHRGVAEFARQRHWSLDVSGAHSFWLPRQLSYDGIICLDEANQALHDYLAKIQLPIVDLSGWYDAGTAHRPRVIQDNHRIGRLVAEHFLERGFQHFAFLRNHELWHERLREAGFVERLKESGFFVALPRHQDMKQTIAQLRRLPRPLALFIPHDFMVPHLLRALLDEGISVPGDIALVGVNNDELLCELAPIPISSVDPDWFGQGWQAASMLQAQLEGKPVPQQTVLIPPLQVVPRTSSDLFTVPDPRTADAIRYIHNNSHLNLTVDDIAAWVGISRSSLQRLFLKHMKSSVNQQIIQARLRQIKRLLANPDLSGTEIASTMHFDSPDGLYMYFRRHTSQSLRLYRKNLRQGDVRQTGGGVVP